MSNRPIPVPPGFLAASVSFTSDLDGWVLGSAPCKQAPCTFVATTTDGGRSWLAIPGPRATLNGGVSELRFADSRDGFAFGGVELWSTHDGGRRWRRLASVAGISPDSVSALQSTPAGVFALVSGFAEPAPLGAGETDGNWYLVRGDATSDRYVIVHHFASPDVSDLVTSGDAAYALANDHLVKIEGRTVRAWPLPSAGCDAGPLAASSPTDLLLVCGQGVGGGGMGDREVYGSSDSGRSWVRLPDPNGAGYDNFGAADGGEGHAAIEAGDAGGDAVMVTTDYARRWGPALTFTGDSEMGLGDLSYQDANHAVVIHGTSTAADAESHGGIPLYPGGGILYRTTDGGDRWSPISF